MHHYLHTHNLNPLFKLASQQTHKFSGGTQGAEAEGKCRVVHQLLN